MPPPNQPGQAGTDFRTGRASTDPREGTFLFLSELIGNRVVGPAGERLGTLVDLLADSGDSAYPRVCALRVRTPLRARAHGGERLQRVEWDDVAACEPGQVTLKRSEALGPLHLPPQEIPLAQEVLDRQILDTDDAKVERVNDLHLLRARGELRVAHVDVGFRGLVRRMGWQRPVDVLVRSFKPGALYLSKEQFVPWKHVKPLSAGSTRVRLDVARNAVAELHPADLAEVLADLDRRERAVLFRELPVEAAAEALEQSEPGLQRELLKMVEPAKAADLLEAMEPDAAADLLGELPQDESDELLSSMEPQEAQAVERLLGYDEDTAGGMMNPDFLSLRSSLSAAAALAEVRAQAAHVAHLHDAYVLGSGHKLVGVVSLRELMLARPDQHVIGLMHDHPAHLTPDDPAGKVAELAAKYRLLSLPVEDHEGRLLGVVTIDDVLVKVLHG